MWFVLIDDAGKIRAARHRKEPGELFNIDGEAPRELVEVEEDDPRLLEFLNPPEPPPEPTASEIIDAMDGVAKGDTTKLDSLKARIAG